MTDPRFQHHPYLRAVVEEDLRYVMIKDTSYGASWKMSGGRSAWFMLKRKIDRMCEMLKRPDNGKLEQAVMHLPPAPCGGVFSVRQETMEWVRKALASEDIFTIIASQPADGSDGTVLAEVRDLRRYLMLVEAEMIARGVVADPTPTRETVRMPDRTMQGQNGGTQEGYVGLRRGNPEADRVATEGRRGANGSTGEWDPGRPPGHDGIGRDAEEAQVLHNRGL